MSKKLQVSEALEDPRGRQGRALPWGPNSFIFMQFSAKKIAKKFPTLGVGVPPHPLASGKSWIRH